MCNVAQSAVLLSIKFFIILNIRSVVLYLIKVIYNRRHNVLQSAVRGTQLFGKRFDCPMHPPTMPNEIYARPTGLIVVGFEPWVTFRN